MMLKQSDNTDAAFFSIWRKRLPRGLEDVLERVENWAVSYDGHMRTTLLALQALAARQLS